MIGSVPVQRGVCTNGPGHWLSKKPWSPMDMTPATQETGERRSTDYERAAAGLGTAHRRQRQTSAKPPNRSAV